MFAGTMQVTDTILMGTWLLSSLPPTFLCFWVLKSEAVLSRRGMRIGGAAAGFIVAFLLARAVFLYGFVPTPSIPITLLLGQWEVFNNDEPDLYAVWTFWKKSDQVVQVSGSVWKTTDATAMGNPSFRKPVISFGPFPIRFRTPATIEFSYESALGFGRAELNVTNAFVGTYVDDAPRTSGGEVDYADIAIYKEQIDRDGFFFRAVAQRSLYTVLLAWVTAGLAYVLFAVLSSTAMVAQTRATNDSVGRLSWLRKTFSITLTGPIAFFYVFFPLSARLLDVGSPGVESFAAEMLPGRWSVEYLSDRTRWGKMLISKGNDGNLNISGDLFFRSVPPVAGGKPRAPFSANSLRYGSRTKEVSFEYKSKVGIGQAKLKMVPSLHGYYVDDIDKTPKGEANAGELLALKRP